MRGESPAARIARLEARVAEPEAEKTKLSTERAAPVMRTVGISGRAYRFG